MIMGLAGAVDDTLRALDVLRGVPAAQVVATLDEARQTAQGLLAASPAPASPAP